MRLDSDATQVQEGIKQGHSAIYKFKQQQMASGQVDKNLETRKEEEAILTSKAREGPGLVDECIQWSMRNLIH
ncbi:UNVERIFIED_CONTAM: hypothetical protein K2H54_029430 [Gekko kuhli]